MEEKVVITMKFGHQGIARAMLMTSMLSEGWSARHARIFLLAFLNDGGHSWKRYARRMTGVE